MSKAQFLELKQRILNILVDRCRAKALAAPAESPGGVHHSHYNNNQNQQPHHRGFALQPQQMFCLRLHIVEVRDLDPSSVPRSPCRLRLRVHGFPQNQRSGACGYRASRLSTSAAFFNVVDDYKFIATREQLTSSDSGLTVSLENNRDFGGYDLVGKITIPFSELHQLSAMSWVGLKTKDGGPAGHVKLSVRVIEMSRTNEPTQKRSSRERGSAPPSSSSSSSPPQKWPSRNSRLDRGIKKAGIIAVANEFSVDSNGCRTISFFRFFLLMHDLCDLWARYYFAAEDFASSNSGGEIDDRSCVGLLSAIYAHEYTERRSGHPETASPKSTDTYDFRLERSHHSSFSQPSQSRIRTTSMDTLGSRDSLEVNKDYLKRNFSIIDNGSSRRCSSVKLNFNGVSRSSKKDGGGGGGGSGRYIIDTDEKSESSASLASDIEIVGKTKYGTAQVRSSSAVAAATSAPSKGLG